ncbi:MAG TPA: xanthine dehydrogenase family protein subunit M [Solirubrobacterales bacterium]
MKPGRFRYLAPESLPECLDLLAEHGDEASLLGGGQSLLPLMSLRIARPEVLIDVNRIPGLDRIESGDDGIALGALVRSAEAEHDPGVAAALPVVKEALRYAGHPPIRNRTTVGGSVAHADSASEWPAVLAVLDGSVRLASKRGERTLRWDEFLVATFMTVREPDEMVVGLELPVPAGMRFKFREVARRHGDFALVGACVGLTASGGTIDDARISLFGVGGTAVRAREAEAILVGSGLDPAAWAGPVRAAIRDGLEPTDDIHASGEYRASVGATLAVRMASELAAEGGGA